MQKTVHYQFVISEELDGMRLDAALGQLVQDYSRSQIQQWIKSKQVTVNQQAISKPRHPVSLEDIVEINAVLKIQTRDKAEPIPLNIVYEDDSILVIDKPAGLVVHPGAGNPNSTLLNALLYHCPQLNQVPRAGIVHRIDKDTTGLMVVAKTLSAQNHLVQHMQEHEIEREYEAVVIGRMTAGGTVEKPIGRHPKHRIKMAVTHNGKPAITHYRVLERFNTHTHIRCMLETGRTHQIRVHMAEIGYPLLGDSLYGARAKLPANPSEQLIKTIRQFSRQALHAQMLTLPHPETHEHMTFESEIPHDIQNLITELRAHYEANKEN